MNDKFIGVFQSLGFEKSKTLHAKIFGYKQEFSTLEELTLEINDWAQTAYNIYTESEYLYKKSKSFYFKIDKDDYFISFLPLNNLYEEMVKKGKRNNEIKNWKNYIHFWASEPSDYWEKLKKSVQGQIKDIIENFKITKTDIGYYQISNDTFKEAKKIKLLDGTMSIFDDQTAISICEKVGSPFIRTLLQDKNKNLNGLHKLAMKCYNKYGGAVIEFLLQLPKLKFGNTTAKNLVNKKQYDGEIPSIKIKVINEDTEYFICFYEVNKKEPTSKIASVYNSKTRRVDGFLTQSGYIQYRIDKENVRLKLFMEKLKNENLIYCSVEPGYCICCGRELSDPTSLKVGYGKTCAENLGIFYN